MSNSNPIEGEEENFEDDWSEEVDEDLGDVREWVEDL